MNVTSIATLLASIGAVIGVGATFWNSQIQLDEMRAGEELRDQQLRSLEAETDRRIQETNRLYYGVKEGCEQWNLELRKLMYDKDTGIYSYRAIHNNISQEERDSYNELCKGQTGLLYEHINQCVDPGCELPRFANNTLMNNTDLSNYFFDPFRNMTDDEYIRDG